MSQRIRRRRRSAGVVRTRLIPIVLLTVVVVACNDDTAPPTTPAPEPPLTAPSTSTSTTVAADLGLQRDYWPTSGWRVSTPEEQGMDSDILADMIDRVIAEEYEIDSVTIVRNGHLVLDTVFYPMPPDTGHIIHSCTKSVVGSLIGVALERQEIRSLDVRVVGILSDAAPEDVGLEKSAMTIEDLLTMTTGLECRDSQQYRWKGLVEMRASDDWATHVLALPMSEEPGTRFEYCNGASHLLSEIITDATFTPALEYAQNVLFEPLGISDVTWPANADGVNFGWGEMVMTPRDMARFGYLYLNDGWWDGTRILPEGWVEEATAPHIDTGGPTYDYGYQWWVANGSYSALGYGGQYIIVAPELDVVAVFTSGLEDRDFHIPETLFNRYVAGAISPDGPLPPNPDGEARIDAVKTAAAAAPEPVDPPEPPQRAAEITGERFAFEPNPGEFAWFQFDFGPDEVQFQIEDSDGPIDVPVGLDGVPRVSDAWGNPWAFTGEWADDEIFVITWQRIGRAARGTFTFAFETDGAEMEFRIATSGTTYDAVAHEEG